MADALGAREVKLVSWNVNGLRATLRKDPDFKSIFATLDADVFAIQETKLQEGQVDLELPGYHQTWSHAERKGYSGTAVFSREKPTHVVRQIGCDVADDEGRVCALEFPGYWLVNVYTPNSKQGLARLGERLVWDSRFREFLCELDQSKPIIACGDFNVAHEEIDLKNPATNHESPGFSDHDRESFVMLLGAGLTDSFRTLHPTLEGAYSWWSYRMRARERNVGWRIDYFLTSDRIAGSIVDASIHDEIIGSDHCPIELRIRI